MNLSLIDFVMMGLSTWRLSSMLVAENGPWFIFNKIRYIIGVRYDANSEPYGENVIGELFSCVWCMSVWIAAIVFTTMVVWKGVAVLVVYPLGLSALAILIDSVINYQ